MKYTILFVFTALVMSIILLACSSSKNNADDSKARKGATSINVKQLSQKWKHVKTKDTYDGVWREVESEPKVIHFTKDGRYSERKPGNDICEGGYVIEGENVVLTHSCNKVALTCKVASLKKDELVLAQKGRHGEVLYVYNRVK